MILFQQSIQPWRNTSLCITSFKESDKKREKRKFSWYNMNPCTLICFSVIKARNIATRCIFYTDCEYVIRALRISPAGCLRADKHRLMKTRSPYNSDMKVLSHCFRWLLFKMEQQGQITPDTVSTTGKHKSNRTRYLQGKYETSFWEVWECAQELGTGQ